MRALSALPGKKRRYFCEKASNDPEKSGGGIRGSKKPIPPPGLRQQSSMDKMILKHPGNFPSAITNREDKRMACFLVTAAEAVVVTVAARVAKNKEMSLESVKLEKNAEIETRRENKLPWSKKLMILASLLWGGAFLLCYEHIWHGEVVPFFPFLTAMNDPGDTVEMLHEMGTVGVTMAVIVTVVWAIMMYAADRIMARPDPEPAKAAA